jgi:serine protease Do
MTRRLAVLVLLLSPVAGLADKPKKAYVGVMIGVGKEEGTIVVLTVLPDSPALKAGLKAGDVLVRINDSKPVSLKATVSVIQALKPGKKAKFEVLRDGKRKVIDVVPGEVD